MSLPASAYLIRKERRFAIKDAVGAYNPLGLRAAKACLPHAEGLTAVQKDRLGAFVSRVSKALWDLAGLEEAGRLRMDWGFPIVIDRPKGFVQTGVAEDGTPWSRTFQVDYGFLPDTIGLDGDEIDVYCGDDPKASMVHVVNQVKADGATLDEYKLMIGFAQTEDALACLFDHLPERYFGAMHTMPLDLLRGLLNFEEPNAVHKALALQTTVHDSLVALSAGTALFGSVQLVKSRQEIRLEKAHATAKAFAGEAIPIESHPALYDHPGLSMWFTGMYDEPERVGGWLGWIEPPDDKWIVFVDVDGKALLWTEREPDGGVIGSPYLFRRDDLACIAMPTDAERQRIMRQAMKDAISVSTFAPGGVKLPSQGGAERVAKPFAGYETFDACVIDQRGNGHTEDEARAICGRLQADAEKADMQTCVATEAGGLVCADKQREIRVAYWQHTPANDDAPTVEIAKGRLPPGEKRLVYGIVLEPEPNGGAGDAHDETYSADVIEQACHDFMAYGQNITSPHKLFANDKYEIVQCFIAPEDYTRGGTVVRQGSWVLVVRVVDDGEWQQILSGKKTAFSIEGIANRILNHVMPQRLAA